MLRRRQEPQAVGLMERGNIIIDGARHKVTVCRQEISLTSTEFKLLELMAKHAGVVLSRERILDAVSGYDSVVCDRTVDAHIKSLRRKLGEAKDYIETVRGTGYRFREV
jgi:DNA-binding response OmpR family regulator